MFWHAVVGMAEPCRGAFHRLRLMPPTCLTDVFCFVEEMLLKYFGCFSQSFLCSFGDHVEAFQVVLEMSWSSFWFSWASGGHVRKILTARSIAADFLHA